MEVGEEGKTIQLGQTSSGHLTLDLMDSKVTERDSMIQDILLVKPQDETAYTKIKKIHRAFGHPSSGKLKETMKDSGVSDEEVNRAIEEVSQNCSICAKYRRRESRPKTRLPRARFFNEVVSLDLKPAATILGNPNDKRQVVYMIDEFSRYTIAAISVNKEAENISKAILEHWCLKGPGYPFKCFHCDNGKEFQKETLDNISRRTGITIQKTPSYSPWANGTIERRHATIDSTIKKLIEDNPKTNLNEALLQSVWVKNQEIGRNGYSPHQVVFGRGSFLPNISEGNLLTDAELSKDDAVRKHFTLQEKTRILMRKAEADRRIKEALKLRVQANVDEVYEPSDKVGQR